MAADTISVSLDGVNETLAADVRRAAAARPDGLPLAELDELWQAAEGMRRVRGGATTDAGQQSGLLPRQVRVGPGGPVLHSPTIAARILLEQAIGWLNAEVAGGEPERIEASLLWLTAFKAYCLAYARDADALASVADRGQAETVVRAWAMKLTVTETELETAIARLTDGSGPEEAQGAAGAEKKSPGTPIGPARYAPSSARRAARRATGSTTCRRAMPCGSCAPSPTASAPSASSSGSAG